MDDITTHGARRRRTHHPVLPLGEEVSVRLEVTGRVVARTYGDEAFVDIVAPDGTIWRNIPAAWVAPSVKVVPLPSAASHAA